jgi:hypothetical protein
MDEKLPTAYDHGACAARHGKHLQACPYDTGTHLYHEWREGFRAGRASVRKALGPADDLSSGQFGLSTRPRF